MAYYNFYKIDKIIYWFFGLMHDSKISQLNQAIFIAILVV